MRYPSLVLALLPIVGPAPQRPDSAEPFLPGIVSTSDANELSPTFAPDGSVLYFQRWSGPWGGDATSTATIYRSELRDGAWTEAAPASFSGLHEDGDPFVSPDGRFLYFTSDRPAPGKHDASADIWRAPLPSGEPQRLPPPLSSDHDEYSPVVTVSGNLYFASARPGGPGSGDAYIAASNGSGFDAPVALGAAVNSPTGEWNLWVDPEETTVVFEASSRDTNLGVPGDLYVSVRSPAGWTPALPVAPLNTEGSDLMPRLSPDGVDLLYASAPLGGTASVYRSPWAPLRAASLAPLSRVLLVANRSSHDVAWLSLESGRMLATQPVSRGPHLLSNVRDGLVVSTGYGIFPRPHARPVDERPPFVDDPEPVLNVIDVGRRSVRHRWALRDCLHPHASWLVDGRAFVTCEDEREILSVELGTGEVVERYPTQGDGSHVLAWHEATRTLVVTSTESGTATLIELDGGARTVLDLGAGSEGSVVVPERAELWVGNAGEGSLSVVDLVERRVVARVDDVCRMPIALSSSSSHVWVACFAGSELVSVSTASRRVARRIPLSDGPLNLLLHESAPLAYVSLPRANAVAEIDVVHGVETRRFDVGIEPDGLRWAEP